MTVDVGKGGRYEMTEKNEGLLDFRVTCNEQVDSVFLNVNNLPLDHVCITQL
jgi:hypothetical protein